MDANKTMGKRTEDIGKMLAQQADHQREEKFKKGNGCRDNSMQHAIRIMHRLDA